MIIISISDISDDTLNFHPDGERFTLLMLMTLSFEKFIQFSKTNSDTSHGISVPHSFFCSKIFIEYTLQEQCQSFSRVQHFATHGLQPTRLLYPWKSPGKKTGVGSHSLLRVIFWTQGLNLGLLHCRQILHHLNLAGYSPQVAKSWTGLSNYHYYYMSSTMLDFLCGGKQNHHFPTLKDHSNLCDP